MWVEIPQVLPQTRPEGGFRPMPAADIVGSEWGAARIGLIVLFIAAGGWIASSLATVLRRRLLIPLARAARLRALRRLRSGRPPGIPPRERALAELDELLNLDPGSEAGLEQMYDRGLRSAREYLRRVRGPEALARTYREMIVDLRSGGARAKTRRREEPHLPIIDGVLGRAERIRFGGAKADAVETRSDLASLREWVMNYPESEPDPELSPATPIGSAPDPFRPRSDAWKAPASEAAISESPGSADL
jgi:hypothetical protein